MAGTPRRSRKTRVVRVYRARSPILAHDARLPPSGQPSPSLPEPVFRRKAKPSSFSVEKVSQWHYGDALGYDRVSNPITALTAHQPHLVLRDRKKPRFVLAYWNHRDLVITSVQRLRTEYVAQPRRMWGAFLKRFAWDPEKETARAKQFARELGIFPSEFLVSEFLHTFRDEILRGKVVKLSLTFYRDKHGSHQKSREEQMRVYRPLIERFFVHKPVLRAADAAGDIVKEEFVLNMNARRVREALGLLPLKK